MLTDSELASMRDVTETWFPSLCTIQTKTEAMDALGGITATFANTYTLVPCRVDPAVRGVSGSGEMVRNFALEGFSTWVLNVAYDQALTIEDRVVYDSVTYEVRGVIGNQSFNLNRQAIIVRVN